MERALRLISVERGFDPREFVLLPFGGAGGLHAVDLARALRIPKVLVPSRAGVLSAIGVLAADVVKSQSRTVMLECVAGSQEQVVQRSLKVQFNELEQTAFEALRGEGFPANRQRHERSLAARYKGQSFELEIKMRNGSIVAAFHRAHLERYGYAQKANTVEIVSVRLRSAGIVEKPTAKRAAVGKNLRAKAGEYVTSFFEGKKLSVAVYQRDALQPGTQLSAPSIVTEYSSTTLIPPGARAGVDKHGNLIIQAE